MRARERLGSSQVVGTAGDHLLEHEARQLVSAHAHLGTGHARRIPAHERLGTRDLGIYLGHERG